VKVSYTIDEQGLNNAIGLELVFLNNAPIDDVNIHKVIPFKLVKTEGNNYTFEATFEASEAGAYKWAVRMFPKNDLLPHRQDFAYVKWIG
jgi:alpha-glucan phosphorylase